MARSKLDEHKLKRDAARGGRARGDARAGAVRRGAGPHDALDPRLQRRGPDHRAGHGARDRRLQVRPDARRRQARPTCRAWPSWAARESCCCAATRRTSTAPGSRRREAGVGPHLEEVFARCEGRIIVTSFASNIHRVQQVVDAAARARAQGLARRALDAQERQHRAPLGHIQVPEGLLVPPREIDDFPDDKLVIISTGSQGEPLSALRRMAHRDHPQVELHDGDTVVFSATPIPGNERAVNETVDRLYHIGCDVITTARRPDPRLGPRLRRGGQADAQPRAPALRDAVPRRLQAHPPARQAGRGGGDRPGRRVQGRERAAAGAGRQGRALRRRASSPG